MKNSPDMIYLDSSYKLHYPEGKLLFLCTYDLILILSDIKSILCQCIREQNFDAINTFVNHTLQGSYDWYIKKIQNNLIGIFETHIAEVNIQSSANSNTIPEHEMIALKVRRLLIGKLIIVEANTDNQDLRDSIIDYLYNKYLTACCRSMVQYNNVVRRLLSTNSFLYPLFQSVRTALANWSIRFVNAVI